MVETHFPSEQQSRASRMAMWRRRATASLCATGLMLEQACYNQIPVAGVVSVPVGEVTIVVNERGRLLVGSRLGTLLDHVTGRIVRADSLQVEVAVQTAEDVKGSMARWGGERFTIPREGIASITEKKVSKGRTALVVAGVIVGFLGFLGLRSRFAGSGDPGGDGGNPI